MGKKIIFTFLFLIFLFPLQLLAVSYKYNEFNQLVEISYINGSTLMYSYDVGGNLLSTKLIRISLSNELCGIYDKDLTLTKAQSPYTITCDVELKLNRTLTIQPGTQIKIAAGKRITIHGTLNATGTATNRIQFAAKDTNSKWVGITLKTNSGATATLDYVDMADASTGIQVECCHGVGANNAATIKNSSFKNMDTAIDGYAGDSKVIIEDSLFEDNTYAIKSADKIIRRSRFNRNEYGLYQTERVSVYSSQFFEHEIALYGGRGEVKDCLITNNATGLSAHHEGFDIIQSTIANNRTGLAMGDYDVRSGKINQSNLFNNSQYNIRVNGSNNKDAAGNWWGGKTTAQIETSIFDKLDNSSLGRVSYANAVNQPYQSSQIDFDGDGIVDSIDSDDDNDGLPDVWELKYSLNPFVYSNHLVDTDKDGLTDLQEFNAGTNPTKQDSDGDGTNDKDEIDGGRDPNVPGAPAEDADKKYKALIPILDLLLDDL